MSGDELCLETGQEDLSMRDARGGVVYVVRFTFF